MSRPVRSTTPTFLAAAALCVASLRPQIAIAAAPETEVSEAAAPTLSEGEEGESAQVLRQQAIDHFQAKDYEGAADYFKRAYAVDPNPNYLFNIGRVYEEAGELEESVSYYERFIQERGVDLESRGLALERLQLLRALIAETTRLSKPEVTEPEPEP
ncbi:MAG TPA: tetratricopeptide repeat protein, partial [Nannocystis exedens]|nr:tetratricopeptide repeat protein [Nannocystis exedens]